MSEKRFIRKGTIISDIQNGTAYLLESASDCNRLLDLLNEQQATISQLQDLCGESDYENAKLRLKNKELQDKIDWLCERYGYNGDGV